MGSLGWMRWAVLLVSCAIIACWTGSACAQYSPAAGNRARVAPLGLAPSDPDPYELAPFSDNTSDSCANRLVLNDLQDHTLHVPQDHDWGILCVNSVDTADNPVRQSYELWVSDWSISSTDWITVDLYARGLDQPPTRRFIHDDDTQPQRLVFDAVGIEQFYYHVYPSGSNPAAYRVRIFKESAPNNGVVKQVGSDKIAVGWPTGGTALPRAAATLLGYSIARIDLSDGTSVTLTSTPIPRVVGCNCPSELGLPGAMCQEYIDTIAVPSPNPGVAVFEYRVYEVFSDGSTSWVPYHMSAVVNFVNPQIVNPFCSGIAEWAQF